MADGRSRSLTLEPFHCGGIPTCSYVPEYVTPEEEQRLLEHVYSTKSGWTQLSGRRLINVGGIVSAKGLLPAPLPKWIQPLLAQLHAELGQQVYGGKPPNHALINAYKPGEGIMPHEDGPAYYPGVCILSLSHPAVIRFRRKQEDGSCNSTAPPEQSLLLMPRSLLVFQDEAYTHCLHGIDEVHAEELDSSVVNLHLVSSSSSSSGSDSFGGSVAGGACAAGAAGSGSSCCGPQESQHPGVHGKARQPGADDGQQQQQQQQPTEDRVEPGQQQQQQEHQAPQPVPGHSSGPQAFVIGGSVPRGGERVSLTIRRVERVLNNLIKLGPGR